MSDVIKNDAKCMTEEQLNFIMSEFGATKGEESPRCKLATELVTLFGNKIAIDEGIYDEDEFENDLKD